MSERLWFILVLIGLYLAFLKEIVPDAVVPATVIWLAGIILGFWLAGIILGFCKTAEFRHDKTRMIMQLSSVIMFAGFGVMLFFPATELLSVGILSAGTILGVSTLLWNAPRILKNIKKNWSENGE
ncbi:hypothetical protein L0Y41_02370 [bacterium]|nr:hypothetical protein [bacterium]